MRGPLRPGTTSSGLLFGLRAHSAESWQRLVCYYAPLIHFWCRRSGISSDDTADLVQDVLLAVTRRFADYRHDRPSDSFRGWLRIITARKVLDWKRTASRRPLIVDEALVRQHCDTNATDASCFPVSMEELQNAMAVIRDEVSPLTWRAFYEVVLMQRDVAEVAHELGLSPNAVYKARQRILTHLRDQLSTRF